MANNQKELLSDRALSTLAQVWSALNPADRVREEGVQVNTGLGALEHAATGPVAGLKSLRSLISLLVKGGKNRGIVGTTFPHRGRPRTTGYPKHDFRPRDPQTGKLMSQVSRDPVWDATQASVRKADAEKIRRAAEWRAEKARRNIDDLIGIDETGMTNIEREQLITKLLKKN